jgi:secreted trypsin-like serine protease
MDFRLFFAIFSLFLTDASGRESDIQGWISNGEIASLGQFPHHALLTSEEGGVVINVFGGALIHRKWVLTVSLLAIC